MSTMLFIISFLLGASCAAAFFEFRDVYLKRKGKQ